MVIKLLFARDIGIIMMILTVCVTMCLAFWLVSSTNNSQ